MTVSARGKNSFCNVNSFIESNCYNPFKMGVGIVQQEVQGRVIAVSNRNVISCFCH